ncbi:MAG: hypothetical protein HN712_16155 [Gemmatimonadetes bacterium]|mgnify:CR=1 FL=1|nr:hypothetical protein [Gemmatimonadota bacterium]MBT6146377.1 hypothetical protein [Gemmatimonadota bacterium]MBT7861848.1 hypothetical protein [Gemmatimonadota bacterium]
MKSLYTLATLVLFFLGNTPGATAQIVASVGDQAITLVEFERRATELRQSGYDHLDTIDLAAKRQLLNGIIAQELIVLEGYRQGVGDDKMIASDLVGIERRALMKVLYDTQALHGDYASTDQELRDHFVNQEFNIEVFSRHIVCDTEKDARGVLAELAAGRPFGALVAERSRPSIRKRFGPEGWVGWFRIGSLFKELRQPMKSMPVDSIYPDPVKTTLGWHVFALKTRRPVPFETALEFLREDLRITRRAKDMESYINGLRERYGIKLEEDGLRALASIDADTDSFSTDQTLVSWQGGRMSVDDYMALVRIERAKHPQDIEAGDLPKRVDNLAGQRVMVAEARRLGLDRLPEVRRKAADRRRELFAKWLYQFETKRRAQADTSAANVRKFYDGNLDLYTRTDGEITDFSVVEGSIRTALISQAETTAMDEFLDELRERFADQVHIDEAALDKAFPDGVIPSAKQGS